MDPVDLAIIAAQFGGALIGGAIVVRSLRGSPARRIVLAALLLVLAIQEAFFRDAPMLIAALRSVHAPAVLDVGPAMLGLMCAYGLFEEARVAKRVAYASISVALFAAWTWSHRPAERDHGGERWSRDVCQQAESWACGPAAVATFLHGLGVEATQDELFRDCQTTRSGTSVAGAFRGVLRHRRDVVMRCGDRSRAAVEALPLPCLCPVVLTAQARLREPRYETDWGWRVGQQHLVVLLERDGDAVVIGDPAVGRERWPLATFIELWTGTGIVATR